MPEASARAVQFKRTKQVNIININDDGEDEEGETLIFKRAKKSTTSVATVPVTSAPKPTPRVPSPPKKTIPESSSAPPYVTKDRVAQIKGKMDALKMKSPST
ncbi:hypothetical protein L6452_40542 [Arctium lappa]|uniref:Uncharacterized protein n=1 Tax=Arctium lappa TaxID=4217 RepID=A0ACB8XMR9_ARCLA|nr:hypothetical protein L6452_40542 [Arctium lappa]